jgi:hypothetical protein
MAPFQMDRLAFIKGTENAISNTQSRRHSALTHIGDTSYK